MDTPKVDQVNLPSAIAAAIDLWSHAGKQHWIPVVGDSMNPALRDGDHVLVSHGYADVRQGDVIVLWQAGRLLIHRLIHVDREKTRLTLYTKGDNARLFDAPIGVADVIGRAIAIKRNGQLISLSTLTWRILGKFIATTTRVNTSLLRWGSKIKHRCLGPQPNRITAFLRRIISMPFEIVLHSLATLVHRKK